ncbi:4-hydroxyphenylacetate 3-hydroxylase family protein [Paenibacillus pasadenensis]|uniref:4-hydroxyphenylacetate 3-monooxygenase n=1 Tax=Paenibacillus pasadenensis TaxID=217090 RepID=A0A2N5NAT5_9BACL
MSAGSRYLERLNDGRNVWIGGKPAGDIREHEALRGTARSVAAVMDLQDDPELGPRLTYRTEDTGARANRAFQNPRSPQELAGRREAFYLWSAATFGVMSRIGGFYRAQLAAWHERRSLIAAEQPQFPDKLDAYFRYVRDNDLLLTAAGHDPQVDRSKLTSELGDAYAALRIVRETEDGLIVRGSKMIATGAPYMDEIMVSPHSPKQQAEHRYAVMFAVPVSYPGLHLVCREPFHAEDTEDHPLSGRYDELDAVLVFDDALIPWERVFIHDDPAAIWKIRSDRLAASLSIHENIARLLAKLEFTAAVGQELAESIGIARFGHVQAKLSELQRQAESVRALLLAAEDGAERHESGVREPRLAPLTTAKNLGNRYYPRAIEILQQLSGAGMLQTPATARELDTLAGGALAPLLHSAYGGADRGAPERVRLLKLAWDLVGSPLGARHELYERFYAGDPARTYAAQYAEYDKSALIARTLSRLGS